MYIDWQKKEYNHLINMMMRPALRRCIKYVIIISITS